MWPPPLVNYVRGFDVLTRKGKLVKTLAEASEATLGQPPADLPAALATPVSGPPAPHSNTCLIAPALGISAAATRHWLDAGASPSHASSAASTETPQPTFCRSFKRSGVVGAAAAAEPS